MAVLAFLAMMASAGFFASQMASNSAEKRRIEAQNRKERLKVENPEKYERDEAFSENLNKYVNAVYADENGDIGLLAGVFASADVLKKTYDYCAKDIDPFEDRKK